MSLCAWACLTVSLSRWLFTGRHHRQVSTLTDLRHTRSHPNIHGAFSNSLMCCPWALPSPMGEVEQRGAQERDGGSKRATLIKGKLIYWCRVRCCEVGSNCLSHSRTLSLIWPISHPLTQSATHLLTWRSFTCSLYKHNKQAIQLNNSEGDSRKRKKEQTMIRVPQKCLISSFVDLQQLADEVQEV